MPDPGKIEVPQGFAVQQQVLPARASQKDRFKRLAAEWKRETQMSSKVKDMVTHLAYQKIIGMGEEAIPFILEDLIENGPNHWFWALHVITDEDPVPKDQHGNLVAMTEGWLQWGRNKGYLKSFPSDTSKISQT